VALTARCPSPLLRQIDSQVPNVVTLSQTVEDLLFEGVSWWRIKAFGWDGFPAEAQHLDVSTVSTNAPTEWRGRACRLAFTPTRSSGLMVSLSTASSSSASTPRTRPS
jgi:hypothetical protein